MTDLEGYRKELDTIDKSLVSLFEKRLTIARNIGRYKKNNSLPIFDKTREEEVLRENTKLVHNKALEVQVEHFFKTIMDLSKDVQKDIHQSEVDYAELFTVHPEKKEAMIGFFGDKGSFCEEAMLAYFKEEPKAPKSYQSFEDLFLAIKNDDIYYGVLPIENSSTGAISQVYDLLGRYGFSIVGEQYIKIEQHLIGLEGTDLDDVEEVYSHPQGFQQSTEYFKNHKKWRQIPFYSTSDSAKLVKDSQDKSKCAIASRRAAEYFGLAILEANIQNESENTTRFIILGKDLESNSECNKVSVVFSLDNQAGTLFKLLSHFAKYHINLIKIESRPVQGEKWEYLLYLDFEGNIQDENVNNALQLIQKNSVYFRLIGSYLAATKNK